MGARGRLSTRLSPGHPLLSTRFQQVLAFVFLLSCAGTLYGFVFAVLFASIRNSSSDFILWAEDSQKLALLSDGPAVTRSRHNQHARRMPPMSFPVSTRSASEFPDCMGSPNAFNIDSRTNPTPQSRYNRLVWAGASWLAHPISSSTGRSAGQR